MIFDVIYNVIYNVIFDVIYDVIFDVIFDVIYDMIFYDFRRIAQSFVLDESPTKTRLLRQFTINLTVGGTFKI